MLGNGTNCTAPLNNSPSCGERMRPSSAAISTDVRERNHNRLHPQQLLGCGNELGAENVYRLRPRLERRSVRGRCNTRGRKNLTGFCARISWLWEVDERAIDDELRGRRRKLLLSPLLGPAHGLEVALHTVKPMARLSCRVHESHERQRHHQVYCEVAA